MSHIGSKIRQRREELGLTQEELATRLGYKSKSTINKIELGINDITQSKIIAFAEALDTTPGVLMEWESTDDAKHAALLRLNAYAKLMVRDTHSHSNYLKLSTYVDKMLLLSDTQLDIIYKMIDQMLPDDTDDSFKNDMSN